jgi:ferredoxin-NADP reductase
MANPIRLKAEVRQIESHGDGVFTLRLLPRKRVPRFKPGQFLHLTLEEFDPREGFWPESRVFSIASSPGEEELVLSYSVKGRYTERMRRELTEGRIIWLKLPYGDFIIEREIGEGHTVILVAGGTGITPFASFLKSELEAPSGRSIRLFYGVRKIGLLLFADLLRECGRRLADFHCAAFLEQETEHKGQMGLAEIRYGRLEAGMLLEREKPLNQKLYFLSGPPDMIRYFQESLTVGGVPADKIRIDQWE